MANWLLNADDAHPGFGTQLANPGDLRLLLGPLLPAAVKTKAGRL